MDQPRKHAEARCTDVDEIKAARKTYGKVLEKLFAKLYESARLLVGAG